MCKRRSATEGGRETRALAAPSVRAVGCANGVFTLFATSSRPSCQPRCAPRVGLAALPPACRSGPGTIPAPDAGQHQQQSRRPRPQQLQCSRVQLRPYANQRPSGGARAAPSQRRRRLPCRAGGTTFSERGQRELAASLSRRVFGDSLAQHKPPERIAGWDGRGEQ